MSRDLIDIVLLEKMNKVYSNNYKELDVWKNEANEYQKQRANTCLEIVEDAVSKSKINEGLYLLQCNWIASMIRDNTWRMLYMLNLPEAKQQSQNL